MSGFSEKLRQMQEQLQEFEQEIAEMRTERKANERQHKARMAREGWGMLDVAAAMWREAELEEEEEEKKEA